MTVCLQGGAEFSPGYRELDAALIGRAGGPVVVSALAGAPGTDYATATANGVRHYRAVADALEPDRGLGAGGRVAVLGAPDAREDRAGALAAIAGARLLVLPGGSPRRLLEALTSTGVDEALRSLLADGATVVGSSAGAMVLCPWVVLPEQGPPMLAPGLGLVPGVVVVPHWTGARQDWLDVVLGDPRAGAAEVLGIPEDTGVVVDARGWTAVGRGPVRLVRAAEDLPAGDTRGLR